MIYTFRQLLDKLILAKAFSSGLDTAQKKEIANEAIEAIITSGRWDGTEVEIQVVVPGSGLLTLPRELVTCKGVRVDGNVRGMASPWYNYLAGTSSLSQFSTNIQDQGDRWAVFKDMRPSSTVPAPNSSAPIPPEPAQLRIVCPGETTTVEVHGVDANGVDIYVAAQHGDVLTFNAGVPAINSRPYFARVTNVILPITDQPATLYACYDNNTQEAIGYYAPGETVPNYRRYLIQEATTAVAPSGTTIVNALCQRRHIDMVADNDVCPISNFKAIRHAVRSLHWLNEGDETRQISEFNDAIKLLNDELKRLRPPSEIGAVRVNAPFSGAAGLFSRR